MLKVFIAFLISIFHISILPGQFYVLQMLLLMIDYLEVMKKHDIINFKNDVQNFFLNTVWDDNYSDLDINLYIQIIFLKVLPKKGNESIYNCQALFSNGSDLRYFDKGVQFFYNSATSLYYDPVLFEPITGYF